MTVTEYKNKVIELFKSGKATQAQWEEMAQAVLDASEILGDTPGIDSAVENEVES